MDTLRKAEPYLDFERLHGHIELSYYGQPILTDKFGDFIKDYWDYMLQAIQSFMKKGSGGMSLPDQPIPITIEEKGSYWVLMTVVAEGEYGQWILTSDVLITSMLVGSVCITNGQHD